MSFDGAVTIFLDANALDGPDLQHSSAEARFRRLGRSADGRVLMVAYTLRRNGDAETIRLISARRASRRERATYLAKVDFSDIPDSSPEQLKAMRRVGRPPLGEEARRRRVGYQTLINEVLALYVRKDVA